MESIMANQPIINLGCLGSVSDGKSTLVEKLTGVKTQRHSSEKIRNITIKQGYGNMKIWSPDSTDYFTTDTNTTTYTTGDGDECKLVNHISFVDCPGHQELIQTMLSSIALMDGAIVVVAVDQPIDKKPQLIQHLAAAKLGKIKNLIICMNKIDLVKKEVLMERKAELDQLLEKYDIKPYVIIPTCFNKNIGIKYLLRAIMTLYNPSKYMERTNDSPLFRVSRTFDINKPGTNWEDINGGVIGGSLFNGTLKVGDKIEIRPGQVSKTREGKFTCQPILTTVLSIKTDTTDLEKIIPGGLIGIRTDLDPFYCKNDVLSGNVAGTEGTLPNVYNQIVIKPIMVTTFGFVWEPKVSDVIMIQIGTKICEAKLVSMTTDNFKFDLTKPVCISNNQHLIICRNLDKVLRIVGEATFTYSDNPNKLV
jgi:translation initiation factor 2 subunit 3